MKLLMTKTLNGLRPADRTSEEALAKVKMGQAFVVEVKRARNARQLALYWALCGLVADHSDAYQDKEQVSFVFKIATGHTMPVIGHDKRTYWQPRSIAFDKMSQDDFNRFLSRCIDVVVTKLLPQVTDAELRAELESICRINQAA